MPQNSKSQSEPLKEDISRASLEKPQSPCFGSGPTNKYPGWTAECLSSALAGRSHRSIEGVSRLQQVITLVREVLEVPETYQIAILPGSATGAVETALWNLLGPRGVDVFSWDVFSRLWATDVAEQLRIEDRRLFDANFGELPDLFQYHPSRDLVFTWNGTTAGVCIPHKDWIPEQREGLSICDATSSAFIIPIREWSKIDAYAFSWQKGIGGEGAHGMLILSPRAVERLQTYVPPWPIPKLLKITKDRALLEGLFEGGKTINTPSMLAVEDAIKALQWAQSEGGQEALWKKCQKNFAVLKSWVDNHPQLAFMAQDSTTISPVSVCLTLKDTPEKTVERIQFVADLLAQRGIAYEIKNHSLAPESFRIWCGPTVSHRDLECLFPWIDWALDQSDH